MANRWHRAVCTFMVLLGVQSAQAYQSFFNETVGEVIIPVNQDTTGTATFDYTDPSKSSDNIFLVSSDVSQAESAENNAAVSDLDSPGQLMQILSPDGKFMVFSTTGGNLHMKSTEEDSGDLSDQSQYFVGETDTGKIFSDQTQRVFHYYSQTMASYGVSRLRLHNTTSIPNTSRMVVLAPVATPNHPTGAKSLLVAATPSGKIYFLAACNLKGQYTKLFVFNKYPEGLEKLKSEEMQSVITGGEVEDCVMIALTNGAEGYSAISG